MFFMVRLLKVAVGLFAAGLLLVLAAETLWRRRTGRASALELAYHRHPKTRPTIELSHDPARFVAAALRHR